MSAGLGSRSTPAPRSRRRWHVFALSIGGLILGGSLLLEGGLRLWDALRGADYIPGRGYTDSPDVVLFERHSYLQAIPRPGASWSGTDPDGKPLTISINAQGFRGPPFAQPKPPGEFRIIALGGSTTFGVGSSSEATTYPRLLEDILNARLQGAGRRVTVINAGVPGYTTAESLINLELRLLDLQPDLVTVYHAYNDIKPNVPEGFRSDYSHWRQPATPYGAYPLEYSRLFVKVQSLYHRLLPSSEETARQDDVSPEGIWAFQRNLQSIINLAEGNGAAVVLSTEATSLTPTNVQEHPERFQFVWQYLPHLTYAGMIRAFDRYNAAIEEVAREEGVALACSREAVPPDFQHFTDHVHLTDAGARKVAEAFAAAVLPLVFPEGPDASPSFASARSCPRPSLPRK